MRIRSDRILFFFPWIGSDFILIFLDRIGSDFVLILLVWEKPNDEKSQKFNKKASQTM